MLGDLFNNPLSFVLGLVGLVIAITIHEFSHAYAAEHLGDPTPRLQGRLTLNPLAHLDPLGTLALLLLRFGWGKPVQFDPYNLRHPRRDAAIISLAGPVANLVLALMCSVLIHILFTVRLTLLSNPFLGMTAYLLIGILQPLIIINVILAIFNLVPVSPLDGFKIVGGMLPEEYSQQWYQLESYGMLFLLFLILPIFGGNSAISNFISPIINVVLSLLLPSAPLL